MGRARIFNDRTTFNKRTGTVAGRNVP